MTVDAKVRENPVIKQMTDTARRDFFHSMQALGGATLPACRKRLSTRWSFEAAGADDPDGTLEQEIVGKLLMEAELEIFHNLFSYAYADAPMKAISGDDVALELLQIDGDALIVGTELLSKIENDRRFAAFGEGFEGPRDPGKCLKAVGKLGDKVVYADAYLADRALAFSPGWFSYTGHEILIPGGVIFDPDTFFPVLPFYTDATFRIDKAKCTAIKVG